MDHRNRNDNWPLLIIGILIILAGAWVLLDRLAFGALEPIRIAFDFIQKVAFPLLLVALGVVFIVLAANRDAFKRADGRRLYRSRKNRMVAGVLGGLAEYFGWDPSLTRIAYVILTIVTGFGTGLLAYIIGAIVIPEAPPQAEVIPPAWPTTYTPPPTSPQPPAQPYAPPNPYAPPAQPTPPQPSAPPTAPSVPEIPAPGTPVPPGQAYPPQAEVPAAPPAPATPPVPPVVGAGDEELPQAPDEPTTPPTNA